ncbi:MAG: hypothetical protein LBU97_03210 [Alistipes sp.]|jgi:hypothetical protein|nr:hypothetical protein [Alistipes sp.]
MKKTNFFKLLMVGAMALSIGFSSCGVSKGDFNKACERIDALESGLAALQAKVDGLEYVKSVVATDEGWLVTPSTGSPLLISFDGPTGGSAGTLSIGGNGNWFIGSADTGFKANAMTPRIVDGYWEFPVFDGGEVVYVQGEEAVAASYAVQTDAGWSLWMPTKDDASKHVEIKIPGAGANVGKIDILGWIQAFDAKADILMEAQLTSSATPDPTELINGYGAEDFFVPYAWIAGFELDGVADGDDTEQATAAAGDGWYTGDIFFLGIDGQAYTMGGDLEDAEAVLADEEDWSAQTDVTVGNVLNTLAAQKKGLLVQVHPATTPVADIVFSLQTSDAKGVLPLAGAKPVLVTGTLLTRAAAESAVWFVPFTYDAEVYEDETDYTDLYVTDAAASLVWAGSQRSEYTKFPFTPVAVFSAESPVEYIQPGDIAVNTDDGTDHYNGAYFKVVVGNEYSLDFDETYPTPNAQVDANDPVVGYANGVLVTDVVIDYFMEVKDNNDYVARQFGVTFDQEKGTFTVGKLADELTLATFPITVYKLGIDGKIYREDIMIYPVRNENPSVIHDKNYLLTDANGRDTGGTFKSGSELIDMKVMFDELAKVPVGSETMATRWQNRTYGAKDWKIAKVVIDGKEVNSTDYTDKMGTAATGDDVKHTLAQWIALFKETSLTFHATNAAAAPALADADLYNARYIRMAPDYVRADGTTPMFDLGSKYELTLEFFDVDGNHMSFATINFTPVIPSLAGQFEKETKYWQGNTLMAYYRAPGSHWDTTGYPVSTYLTSNPAYFYDNENDGLVASVNDIPWANSPATPGSTFYNVFSDTDYSVAHKPTTPFDGGYVKFGNSKAADKQWLDGTSALDYRVIDEDNLVSPYQLIGEDEEDPDSYLDYFVEIGAANTAAQWQSIDGSFAVTNFNKGTVVALHDQTPYDATEDFGYNEPLNLTITPGAYLAVYDYTYWADEDGNEFQQQLAEELEDLDFDLQLMSALERGTVEGAGAGGKVNATIAGNGIYDLTDADFVAENYNGLEYSLFLNETGRYDYNYVYRVEFYIPQGGTPYVFVDADGDRIDSTMATQIDAVVAPPAATIPARVRIQATNADNSFETKIGVRVIDRFGRVKETEVPLSVTRR